MSLCIYPRRAAGRLQAVLATRDRMRGLLGLLIDDPRPDGPYGSGVRGGPGDGFERECNDLAAVHLFAPVGAQAEFGVGEVLVQQRRRLAKAVGVGPEGRRAGAG